MRKGFSNNIPNELEKNSLIDAIKEEIKSEYIDKPNNEWELGHKNPDLNDNSANNMVLQPPIQGKYRDDYIFIDTLTKIPTPKKLETIIKKKEVDFSENQIDDYINLFQKLKLEKSKK